MKLSVLALSMFALTPGGLSGAEVKERDPGELSTGSVQEWKSADGLVYQYRLPKSYDPKVGANLTFVLHGSNLSRAWGFANHKPDTFRPDDIVVCPDGTSANGKGGFNFIGEDKDLERMHALHAELKETFKVHATYLYGHSQGSFFALHYAGAYPDEVQGVVAHASGLWTWTKRPEAAHHQAIVFLHGTQDPVVPYGQSVGGFETLRKAGYPTVRMRSLEGWNHWPAEHNGPIPHTSQQLAWVEGMTTLDPGRQAAAFKTLSAAKAKEDHDFAGLYLVAERIASLPDASAGAKRVSENAIKSVRALAEKHIAELAKTDPAGEIKPGDEAWIGHLPMFLRAFQGVPECEALRGKWSKVLTTQQAAVATDFRPYYDALRAGDNKLAFSSGAKALRSCFLTVYASDTQFLANLNKWEEEARALELDKDEVAEFKALSRNLAKAREDGRKAFEAINRKAPL